MSFNFTENVTIEIPDIAEKVKILNESEAGTQQKLLTEIAAIHVGLTANFNMYTEENLRESVDTWVTPYPKPVIINHDETSDPLGRVMAAKMDKESDGTPFIAIQTAITSPNAVERVLDERYMTGSVGGRASKAFCSVCRTDWGLPLESKNALPCVHRKGKVYDGQVAYLELAGITWVEYSFVNIPADKQSKLKNIQLSGSGELDDSWTKAVKVFSIDMNKESIIDLDESNTNILESMQKPNAVFTYKNVKGTFLTAEAFDALDRENEEKITFINKDTTIESEASLLAPEENDMSKNEDTEVQAQDDDILSVADALRASQEHDENVEEDSLEESAESSDQETDSKEDSETASVEANSEEEDKEPESADVEEDTKSEEEEKAEDESEAKDTQIEDSSDKEDEPLVESDEEDETSDDAVSEIDEKVDESEEGNDSALEELRSEVEALRTENASLRENLHYMLAERVVDAKINVGIISNEDRSTALKEHEARTASSLADALRDTQSLTLISPKFQKESAKLDVKSQAVEGEDSAHFEGQEIDSTPKISESDRYVETFSAALMGRKQL